MRPPIELRGACSPFVLWACLCAIACGSDPQGPAHRPATPLRAEPVSSGWRKAEAGRPLAPSETYLLEQLLRATEQVRGLRFLRPVPVVVHSERQISRFVAEQLRSDDIERARAMYVALGLLQPQLDVRALLLRLMGEQVLGA